MRRAVVTVVSVLLGLSLIAVPAVGAPPPEAPPKQPVATGLGGAAATVDVLATEAAIDVLADGGNAVDAAVTAAAVLGVTDPYSCGIGGGGFMVVYRAADDTVHTNDHREAAPAAFEPDTFIDPATGQPYPFAELVTSGLGVGVPGTVLGWQRALRRFGTRPLSELLQPAIDVARDGFVVDQTFHDQTEANRERFSQFESTRQLFLDGNKSPRVGSVFRNRDLAETLELIARRGTRVFYEGRIGDAIVEAVQDPPLRRAATYNVRPGLMESSDLESYRAPFRPPTHVSYRGLDVYGMGPPSSGGSTVGEALNILEGFDLSTMPRAEALHLYLEASALAFADRNAYLGDPDFVDVPLDGLLSDDFAAERRELIGPTAATKPVAAGNPWPYDGGGGAPRAAVGVSREGRSTTHLTVADADGNVVSYTFTIEQTGGSGIVVPDYGFLLNNELTDFNFVPPHPNAPDGGKRPRSSMSPTIVLDDGEPVLALGSPGGSTIITTVLQMLVNRTDFGMTLPEALAAPRASQRNSSAVTAEPEFIASPEAAVLSSLGHSFSSTPEIGAATAIEILSGGLFQAAAEPVRRGGGSALVVQPAP